MIVLWINNNDSACQEQKLPFPGLGSSTQGTVKQDSLYISKIKRERFYQRNSLSNNTRAVNNGLVFWLTSFLTSLTLPLPNDFLLLQSARQGGEDQPCGNICYTSLEINGSCFHTAYQFQCHSRTIPAKTGQAAAKAARRWATMTATAAAIRRGIQRTHRAVAARKPWGKRAGRACSIASQPTELPKTGNCLQGDQIGPTGKSWPFLRVWIARRPHRGLPIFASRIYYRFWISYLFVVFICNIRMASVRLRTIRSHPPAAWCRFPGQLNGCGGLIPGPIFSLRFEAAMCRVCLPHGNFFLKFQP